MQNLMTKILLAPQKFQNKTTNTEATQSTAPGWIQNKHNMIKSRQTLRRKPLNIKQSSWKKVNKPDALKTL